MSKHVKSLSLGEWAAVCYGQIFDWPLTFEEAKLWRVANKYCSGPTLRRTQSYRAINGATTKIRHEREKVSTQKRLLTQKSVDLLKKIPAIEAIFLTGSVAMENAKQDADIDLMIITKPQTLWLTRIFMVILLKWHHLYANNHHTRDHVCPNIFLDTNNMEIMDKNLFTAHEILQAKCLFDRGGVKNKWLEKNKWAQEYLPNAYDFKLTKNPNPNSNGHQFPKDNSQIGICNLRFGYWNWMIGFLNYLVFICQYLYMKPKITNEKIGLGFAFFHPKNLSQEVLLEYEKRLKSTQ